MFDINVNVHLMMNGFLVLLLEMKCEYFHVNWNCITEYIEMLNKMIDDK